MVMSEVTEATCIYMYVYTYAYMCLCMQILLSDTSFEIWKTKLYGNNDTFWRYRSTETVQ